MDVRRKKIRPNFLKNKHFLSPDTQTYACVSRGRKCSLFGKFGVLCFLVISCLLSTICSGQNSYISKSVSIWNYAIFQLHGFWNIKKNSFKFSWIFWSLKFVKTTWFQWSQERNEDSCNYLRWRTSQ